MRKRPFILASAAAAAILCAPRATFADYEKEFNVKFAGYAGQGRRIKRGKTEVELQLSCRFQPDLPRATPSTWPP